METLPLEQQLLYGMLRIRRVEEAIAERYSEKEMRCPVHLSIGQEAVAVGVCAALEHRDYVFSTHRGHAHYLAKGGNLKAMLAEIYGREDGCCSGKGGSMHLVDLEANFLGCTPIVGSSLPVAVGTAFGSWLKGEDPVTVAFFGEGTTEEGVFSESINFASLKELPVVFVCENNLYSVYSPLSVRQPPGRDRIGIAKAHGMRGAKGNGNNVTQVLEMSCEAVDRARNGGGPTFLEFDTYRWREHCGPDYDNDLGYRTEAEFLEWRQRCPLENYQTIVTAGGEVSREQISRTRKSIDEEIERAFEFAKASPYPSADQLFSDVYAGGKPQ